MESTDNINKFVIEKIQRQTNYTEDQSKAKLIEHKGDELNVIKEYLGIDIKNNKKNKTFTSINQEIYSQIRTHLNQPNNSAKYMEFKE